MSRQESANNIASYIQSHSFFGKSILSKTWGQEFSVSVYNEKKNQEISRKNTVFTNNSDIFLWSDLQKLFIQPSNQYFIIINFNKHSTISLPQPTICKNVFQKSFPQIICSWLRTHDEPKSPQTRNDDAKWTPKSHEYVRSSWTTIRPTCQSPWSS